MTGLGGTMHSAPPPTLTPVDRNKAHYFWQDKFVVVDKPIRNNVCYGKSVLPLLHNANKPHQCPRIASTMPVQDQLRESEHSFIILLSKLNTINT